MFDTHCHLNFAAFDDILDEVLRQSQAVGVYNIVIPATDIPTARRAIEIANKYEHIYCAVGIHPHHVFELYQSGADVRIASSTLVDQLTEMAQHERVVAIGEVGIDRHYYTSTRYKKYDITERFITYQKLLLEQQIALAVACGKSLILHNRESKQDLLQVLSRCWNDSLRAKTVFHCCEPDLELLAFAKQHDIYIGVDGDVTYDVSKQAFIKQVPLSMLVVETDAPFIVPEPAKSQKIRPNTPANLPYIVNAVAQIKGISNEAVIQCTTENAHHLFGLTKK